MNNNNNNIPVDDNDTGVVHGNGMSSSSSRSSNGSSHNGGRIGPISSGSRSGGNHTNTTTQARTQTHTQSQQHDDTLYVDGIEKENPAYTACKIWCYPTDEHTSEKLKTLSLEEREKVWGDMSGDSKLSHYEINPEEPTFVENCLQELHEELNKLSSKDDAKTSSSFEYVKQHHPEYVFDRKRLLMFLRSESFHPKLTAKHIIGHYEFKEELFGKDKLGRDIMLCDLNEDDMESLSSGGFQYMDQTDHAGRPICFSRLLALKAKTPENACRAIWYNAQVASSNEQYQKLGAVCIPYMMDDFPEGGIDYEFIRKTSKTGVFGFMRIVSAYILCRNPAWNSLTDLLGFLFGNRIKLRTRPIGGTMQECKYKLMCIGIPPSAIPVTEDGTMDNSRLHRWIAYRKWHEGHRSMPTKSITDTKTPSPMIVVGEEDDDNHDGNVNNMQGGINDDNGFVGDDDGPVSPTASQDAKRIRQTYYGSGKTEQSLLVGTSSGGRTGSRQQQPLAAGGDLSGHNKRHIVNFADRS